MPCCRVYITIYNQGYYLDECLACALNELQNGIILQRIIVIIVFNGLVDFCLGSSSIKNAFNNKLLLPQI